MSICQASHTLRGDLGVYMLPFYTFKQYSFNSNLRKVPESISGICCANWLIYQHSFRVKIILSAFQFFYLFISLSTLIFSCFLCPFEFHLCVCVHVCVCVFQVPINHLTGMSRKIRGKYVFSTLWWPKHVFVFFLLQYLFMGYLLFLLILPPSILCDLAKPVELHSHLTLLSSLSKFITLEWVNLHKFLN